MRGLNDAGAVAGVESIEALVITGLLDLCIKSGQPFLFTYQPPAMIRIKMIFFMDTFLRVYLSQSGFQKAVNVKPVVDENTASAASFSLS